METLKRVPNWKIKALFRERVPFENYNQSITAEMVEGYYRVWHWNTHLLTLDTNSGAIIYFDFAYYSQTTSTLQGRIVRNLLSHHQIKELLASYKLQGRLDKVRRLLGMARIR